MGYYTNKKVWITGASSGIGRALAQAVSEQGGYVILSARTMDNLQETQQLLSHPDKSAIYELDMSDEGAIAKVARRVLDDHQGIDILVQNAGISQRSLALDTTLSVSRRIMEVNYFGVVTLSKMLLPDMIAKKTGQIVVISSVNGKLGSYMKSSYAASKHALHGYFDSLRAEISDSEIDITLITPGYVQSNISMHALTSDGTPLQSMDSNTAEGVDTKVFAVKALKQIAKRKEEFAIGGGIETVALYLKRFAPGLLSKIAARRKEA